jgi:hypothetical protein
VPAHADAAQRRNPHPGRLYERKVDLTLDTDVYLDVPITDEVLTLDIADFGAQVLNPVRRHTTGSRCASCACSTPARSRTSWQSTRGSARTSSRTPATSTRTAGGVPTDADDGAAVAIANTSAAADDIIDTSTAHGFVAGDRVVFTALTGGAGLTTNREYYVIAANLAASSFQVSTSVGGAAVNFTTDITAGSVRKNGNERCSSAR